MLRRRPPIVAPGSLGGLSATLAVELSGTPDSVAMAWANRAFAESLATRLRRMPGLEVLVVTGEQAPQTDFTLRGDMTVQVGRLVIVSRLYEKGEERPIWTDTFWQSPVGDSNIVDDWASELAQALYGHLARHAVTMTRESR